LKIIAEKVIDCVNKVLKLDFIKQDEDKDILFMLDVIS
jgi:hypothetical protein